MIYSGKFGQEKLAMKKNERKEVFQIAIQHPLTLVIPANAGISN